MKRLAVAIISILSALAVAMSLWQAVAPFVPHQFWGVSFGNTSGHVTRVYPAELPPGVRIAVGDRQIEKPDGDPLRGYRLRVPEPGDTVHVATAGGIVTLHPSAHFYPPRDAAFEALRQLTAAAVIAFAGLLFARRPGVMAFAFWISAIYGTGGGDLDFSLDRLPRQIGFALSLLISNALNYGGFAWISFALRFPAGRVAARWRWLDRALWIALGMSAVTEVALGLFYYAGRFPWAQTDQSLATVPLVGAAAIFIMKQARAAPIERPRLAWATVAFVTAAAFRAVALLPGVGSGGAVDWRFLEALSNLCLLLAMYPVLRYRLFNLGFVINRAAVYSVLTLAAFGTLAAVNWIAQHFVTDHLAFVLQPVAAIAIGLGYFRVRSWVQRAIEGLLFRERLAAEEYLETLIQTLPFAERAGTIDDALVTQVARTLRLSSAALFRAGDGFQRVLAQDWSDALLTRITTDDIVARKILTGDTLVALESVRWNPGDLPQTPREPVVALGIIRRGSLSALVLYGRHANGTELEPEELRLLRRLGNAAAVAYETVDVVGLREQNEALQLRIRVLEGAPVLPSRF